MPFRNPVAPISQHTSGIVRAPPPRSTTGMASGCRIAGSAMYRSLSSAGTGDLFGYRHHDLRCGKENSWGTPPIPRPDGELALRDPPDLGQYLLHEVTAPDRGR